jgi:allophanate hydrolase subunit 1
MVAEAMGFSSKVAEEVVEIATATMAIITLTRETRSSITMVAEVISSIQEMDCRTTAFMLDHQELVERMQEMQSRILFISDLDTDSSSSPTFIILIPLIYLLKTKTSRLLLSCLKKTMFLL